MGLHGRLERQHVYTPCHGSRAPALLHTRARIYIRCMAARSSMPLQAPPSAVMPLQAPLSPSMPRSLVWLVVALNTGTEEALKLWTTTV